MKIFRALRDKPRMTWNQLIRDPFLFFWSLGLCLQAGALVLVIVGRD